MQAEMINEPVPSARGPPGCQMTASGRDLAPARRTGQSSKHQSGATATANQSKELLKNRNKS